MNPLTILAAWCAVALGLGRMFARAEPPRPVPPTLTHVTDPPNDYGYSIPEDAWDQSLRGLTPNERADFDRLVDRFADLREGAYGSEDMAEWERELLYRGEDA